MSEQQIIHEDNPQIQTAEEIVHKFRDLDKALQAKVLEELRQICRDEALTSKKRKREKYEDEMKIDAVEFFKNTGSYEEAAQKFNEHHSKNIDESYARRWVSERLSEEEIEQIKKKFKKTGRHEQYPEMEDQLKVWFQAQREKKIALTLKTIQNQALKIFDSLKEEASTNKKLTKYANGSFKASLGWFRRFRRRAGISRRMGTHTASKLAENYSEQMGKFIMDVKLLR